MPVKNLDICISPTKLQEIISKNLYQHLYEMTNKYQVNIDYNTISNNIVNELKQYCDIY